MSNPTIEERPKININFSYPNSDIWSYETRIETINFDKESEKDINTGSGFLISSPKSTNKKDMKNPDGIYSSKFGQKLGDANPYADRYSCECGNLKSRINRGMTCPICGQKCKYVDDDFKMFGWIRLKPQYHVIHPKFYDILNYIFSDSPYNTEKKKIKGSKLNNILNYCPDVDQHGFATECSFKPENEPFYGIGMTEFYERFDEILEYYIEKYPKKIEYYNDLEDHRYSCECGANYTQEVENGQNIRTKFLLGKKCKCCNTEIKYVDKDIIFTHNIPVFTTHLRPADIRDGYMYYEPTNGIYNMINRHVHIINKDRRKLDQDIKMKQSSLFKVQMKIMELTNEIYNILSGKKGQLRMLIGGRFNFSSRDVIRQDSSLRIDQVKLPYVELVKCLQQRIINILIRSYNISPAEAYDIWNKALNKKDERVAEILDTIIHSEKEGLPVIINRNPSLKMGSVLQMFCIGYTDTLTMSMPLQVLKLLAADFDGDVLNVFHIINQAFFERSYIIFNPRNAMYISRMDGKMDSDVIVQRDTLINANTFIHLGRKNYTQENLDKIARIKAKQKEYFSEPAA